MNTARNELISQFRSKLTTTIVSTFTSYYVFLWSKFLPDKPLTPPLPSFDGRAVCYPSDTNLRDYMSWRQVDCEYRVRMLGATTELGQVTSTIFTTLRSGHLFRKVV